MSLRSSKTVGLILFMTVLFSTLAFGTAATQMEQESAGKPKLAQPGLGGVMESLASGSNLAFAENRGQFREEALFLARIESGEVWLTDKSIWLSFSESSVSGTTISEKTSGANVKINLPGMPSAAQGVGKHNTQLTYMHGSDPAGWQRQVPTWKGVVYQDLFSGLDLLLMGSGDSLQLIFICQADCLPALSRVQLQVDGIKRLRIEDDSLKLSTATTDLLLPRPLVYLLDQPAPEWMVPDLTVADSTIHVKASSRRVDRPLTESGALEAIADKPEALLYSTFLGGSDRDETIDLAMDNAGNIYLAGLTYSADFPVSSGAVDTVHAGQEAYVAKFDRQTREFVYITFLGGSGSDTAAGVAVDGQGNAFVTGATSSTDFPATPGAFSNACSGYYCSGFFVAKLNNSGSDAHYIARVWGQGFVFDNKIVVDAQGNAYVGVTNGYGGFPTTYGAYDRTYNGGQSIHNMGDLILLKLNASGSQLIYSTYLGGAQEDSIGDIAVDASGYLYVTGRTRSRNFPTTYGAYDRTCGTDARCNENPDTSLGYGGPSDVFVTKLSPAGSYLVYSTFVGSSKVESGYDIILQDGGNAIVTGETTSSGFPTTYGAYDRSFNYGSRDAFAFRLNSSGSSLSYSTFIGGYGGDAGLDLGSNEAGDVFIVGTTDSGNFPVSEDAYDQSRNGDGSTSDIFIFKLAADGSDRLYGSYFGGEGSDIPGGIAVSADDQLLMSGRTHSPDFPTTLDAADGECGTDGLCNQGDYSSKSDAFLSEIGANPDLALASKYSPYLYRHPDELYWPIYVKPPVNVATLKYDGGELENPNLSQLDDALYNKDASYLDFPCIGVFGKLNFACDRRVGGAANYWNTVNQLPAWQPAIFARVKTEGEVKILQYWYFFFHNPSLGIGELLVDHEGDWEMIQIVLDAEEKPIYAVYSEHGHPTKRLWDHVAKVGDHPKVFYSKGNHAGYFRPYDYRVSLLIIGYGLHSFEDQTGTNFVPTPSPMLITGQEPWMMFKGRWGSVSSLGHKYTNGWPGPSQREDHPDAWSEPLTWADNAEWDELSGHNNNKFVCQATLGAEPHVYEITTMQHVGKRSDGTLEIGIGHAEYIENSYAQPGHRVIIVHQSESGDWDSFYCHVQGQANGSFDRATAVPAATNVISITARIPDYDNNKTTELLFSSVTLSPTSRSVVSTTNGIDYYLAVDSDGDGSDDYQLEPTTLTTVELDFTPPAPITDLFATVDRPAQARLSWTASGDDGLVGSAGLYEIRYHRQPITDENWASATQVIDPPRPSTAGSNEAIDVPILPGGRIFFAIKVVDDANLSSGLSNVFEIVVPDFRSNIPLVSTN